MTNDARPVRLLQAVATHMTSWCYRLSPMCGCTPDSKIIPIRTQYTFQPIQCHTSIRDATAQRREPAALSLHSRARHAPPALADALYQSMQAIWAEVALTHPNFKQVAIYRRKVLPSWALCKQKPGRQRSIPLAALRQGILRLAWRIGGSPNHSDALFPQGRTPDLAIVVAQWL